MKFWHNLAAIVTVIVGVIGILVYFTGQPYFPSSLWKPPRTPVATDRGETPPAQQESQGPPGLAIAGNSSTNPSAPTSSVSLGTLTCNVANGADFMIGVSQLLLCVFRGNDGTAFRYSGRVSNYGVDIGYRRGYSPVWTVMVPVSNVRPDRLSGDYVRAGSEGDQNKGAAADVLSGGQDGSISLLSLTTSSDHRVRTADGINAMSLNYLPGR